DEPLVELETDKVTLEFNAPASGVLAEIKVEEGGEVEVGALLGSINEEAGAVAAKPRATEAPAEAKPAPAETPAEAPTEARPAPAEADGAMAPAVRKLIEEHGLDPAQITPTGP